MIFYKKINAIYENFCVKDSACAPFTKFATPKNVYDSFCYLRNESKEYLLTLHLDCGNKLICIDTVSIGTLNSSQVHPREVLKTALLSSANSIIMLHNHPSGETNPSTQDIYITKKLKHACDLMGIGLLDHIIIGDDFYSFKENTDILN